jgi:hypothetical protein
MVAPRKKTPGFSSKPVEIPQEEEEIEISQEEKEVEPLTEMVLEETPQEPAKVVEDLPVVIHPVVESIDPTEDTGPRFVEKKVEEVVSLAPAPVDSVIHPPKRNPRNIPRFSRYK